MTKAKLSPLPPNTVLNGYTIVRQVSEGGFSLVYLARDPQNQQVAIKEYLPSSLASRSEGQLAPQVLPDKLSLYRLGLKSFFEEGRSLSKSRTPPW